MASVTRFRSLQRACAALVGLAPVVALHTVAPGVIHETLFEFSAIVMFSGPAVVFVLAIAYGLRRLTAVWATIFVSVACASWVMVGHAAEHDGSLWLFWWSPAYVTAFLAGFVFDAVLESAGIWRTVRCVIAILLAYWGLRGMLILFALQVNGPEFAREGIVSGLGYWAVVALLALLAWPKRRRTTA